MGVRMTPPVFPPSRVMIKAERCRSGACLKWMGMTECRCRGFDDLGDLLLRGPPPYTSICWPSCTVTLLEFPEVLAKAPCLRCSSHPPLLFGKCRFLLDVFLRHQTDAVFIAHLKFWVWSFLAMSNHEQTRWYGRSAFSVYTVKNRQLIERHPLRAWCWSSVRKRRLKYFFCNG